MQTDGVDVIDWTSAFVSELFLNRGYNPEDNRYASIIGSQASNWRRLLAENGILLDDDAASDAAYEFSNVAIKGGAGRIYEAFSDYLKSRPKPAAQPVPVSPTRQVHCSYCGGSGAATVDIVNRYGTPAVAVFRCVCEAAIKYAGIPPATREILDASRDRQKADREQSKRYFAKLGVDLDRVSEIDAIRAMREHFRRMHADAKQNGFGRLPSSRK